MRKKKKFMCFLVNAQKIVTTKKSEDKNSFKTLTALLSSLSYHMYGSQGRHHHRSWDGGVMHPHLFTF